MARAPNEKISEAYELYKSGIKLVEIASQLNIPPGTVRRWKSTHNWDNERSVKNNERSQKNRDDNKAIAKEVKQVLDNSDLTDKQRLFCLYYSKSFNATQSYLKAYNCTYETALVAGPRMLGNVRVREEIENLKDIKRQQILAGEDDLIDMHMRIAFADIGDYVSFGREEVQVMGPFGPIVVADEETGDKIELTKIINTVKLKESAQVDTQLIKEIKQGKDGVGIKLLDRCKSLDWLDKFFLMNPMDKHKIEYDKRKLEIELIKAESEIKANEPETSVDDDNFIDALNATAKDVWSDEE